MANHALALPVENCLPLLLVHPGEQAIVDLIRRGNLPQAEIFARIHLQRFGPTATTLNFLGWIAARVGLICASERHFEQAAGLAPDWGLPESNLSRVRQHRATHGEERPPLARSERYLLIKAWGFGFWSDVSHIVGQLLLAELTGRTPVVHWGKNSLFWDGSTQNAFESYFEPVSPVSLDELRARRPVWPPKWNAGNLFEGELNKWGGPYSRIPGLYLLARDEPVVVSDFFTSVHDLKPWIPPDSEHHGSSIGEIHANLLRKYLRPKPEIIAAVDRFHGARLGPGDFIAVHARGSDKNLEVSDLDALNQEYAAVIGEFRDRLGSRRIFLLTDDSRLRSAFVASYGDDVTTTDCQRTDSDLGVHYQASCDRRRLGTEVMVDAYLAIRAQAFVGNGLSNPSLMIRHLKHWPEADARLLGGNMFLQPNTFLHDW